MFIRYLLRLLETAFGLALEAAGLLGANSGPGSSPVIAFFSHPAAYISAVALGTVILVYTWGEALAEHRITNAGGRSKKEFAADFANWDRVGSLTVWQSAWLWSGLEPHDLETRGTPVYAALRKLKEDLNKGLITGAERGDNGSWRDVPLGRQQLIDYAYKIGERPAFLFPEERTLLSRVRHRLFGERELTPEELRNYHDHWTWVDAGRRMNPPLDVNQIAEWVKQQLREGNVEVAATVRRKGIQYPHVKIPQAALTGDFNFWRITYQDREYEDIRVKYTQPEVSI